MNTKDSSFSLHRVGLLIKRYFAERQNRSMQLVMWVVLLLLFSAEFAHFFVNIKQLLYFYAVIIPVNQFGFFYTGKTDTINYLLIPSSSAEKTVVAFILNTVYFLVAIVLTYCFVNLVGTALLNIIHGTSNPVCLDFLSKKGVIIDQFQMNDIRVNIWNFMGQITIIQALAVLTQFGFSQKSFWKHVLLGLLFFIPAILLLPSIIDKLTIKINSLFGSLGIESFHISSLQIINVFQFSTLFIYFLVAALIWRLNYLGLSKKQIV